MKKKLAEIAQLKSGYTLREGLAALPAGDVLVFQAKDVGTSTEGLPAVAFENDKQNLEDGDVLLSVRGTFRAGVVQLQGKKGIAASSVLIIRVNNSKVQPEYLAAYLNSPPGQEQLQAIATGAAIRTVTKAELAKVTVPIPTLAVQVPLIELERNVREQQHLITKKYLLLNRLLNATNANMVKETHQ